MIASRFVSVFFAVCTFGLLSYATPVAEAPAGVAKRADVADIADVFNNLKLSTDSILPQLDALAASGNANDANVAPLISQLTDSLTTADTQVNELRSKPNTGRPGPSKDELAKIIAEIVIAITKTVNGLVLVGVKIPTLSLLLIKVDTILNKLLLDVEILLAGILKLVAVLLVDIAGLLKSIAFGLTLATLKLHGL